MKYVSLGTSGLKVSRVCLGMMSYGDPPSQPWILSEDLAEDIVRRAVEAGVTFFDTADMYSGGGSERMTGRLLRKYFSSRDDYVLATKVYFPTGSGVNDRGLSRKHMSAAIDASLRPTTTATWLSSMPHAPSRRTRTQHRLRWPSPGFSTGRR